MIDESHIEDQAAARALGALPPEEQARVDRHVDVCPPCKQMLREAEAVASLLALTVQPARPSSQCKARLMALIEREPYPRTARRGAARILQAAPIVAGFSRFPVWAARAVTAAALVGLLIWNLSLQRQIAQTRRIQYMVVTDHQPTALKPMGTYGKSVAARVFHGPSGSDAVLVIENLPSPPPGKVYQVWVTNEQHQRPLHTLRGVHNVEQLLMQPDEPLSRYKWVMITVEDAAGSRFPSKTMVLAGDL